MTTFLTNCIDQSRYNRVISFINTQLRPDNHYPIQSEYPTILHPDNRHNMTAMMEDTPQGERVLGHIGFFPYTTQINQTEIRVAGIGSVVTDQKQRGKGIASKIMSEVIANIDKQGIDFSILWTDLFQFYQKFGFQKAGHENLIQLANDDLQPMVQPLAPAQHLTNELYCTDSKRNRKLIRYAPALLKVYQTGKPHILRDAALMRAYLSIPEMRVLLSKEKGEISAYLIIGKGTDLTSFIHEWAGKPTHILNLLSTLLQKYPEEEFTLLFPNIDPKQDPPRDHQIVIDHIKRFLPPATEICGHLGMIRIHQPIAFWNKLFIQPFFSLLLERENIFCFCYKKEGAIQGKSNYLDQYHLVNLLFGHAADCPAIIFDDSHATHHWRELIQPRLPLPFFIWGLDSV